MTLSNSHPIPLSLCLHLLKCQVPCRLLSLVRFLLSIHQPNWQLTKVLTTGPPPGAGAVRTPPITRKTGPNCQAGGEGFSFKLCLISTSFLSPPSLRANSCKAGSLEAVTDRVWGAQYLLEINTCKRKREETRLVGGRRRSATQTHKALANLAGRSGMNIPFQSLLQAALEEQDQRSVFCS